jgi:PIN domain nuclease of toxin-antitoxin system
VRLLLDTHALIWWLAGDSQLPVAAQNAITDEDNSVYVSAASAWEVTTKARLGKLPNALALAQDFARQIEREGFAALAISVEHAERAGNLPGPHKDPFDRMLIAQAQAENLVLVSNEMVFDQYGITRWWD